MYKISICRKKNEQDIKKDDANRVINFIAFLIDLNA